MGQQSTGVGQPTRRARHQPALMLRTDSALSTGVVQQTTIFCPRCGRTACVDEGYLERGGYLCDGVVTGNTYVRFGGEGAAGGFEVPLTMLPLPGVLQKLAGTLLAGQPLDELAQWRPQSGVERAQAAAVALALTRFLGRQLDALEAWSATVMSGPE